MILTSLAAEHDALFLVADKWEHGEVSEDEVDAMIQEAIDIHMNDEEAIFFPAVEPFWPEEVGMLRSQHEAIRQAYKALSAERRKEGLKRVLQQLLKHIEEEERQLFDRAEDRLGAEELRFLQAQRKACSCRGHY